MNAKIFVPAHADVTEDILPSAQYNIDKVHEIAEKTVTLCKKSIYFEMILQKLSAKYSLTMNFEQYVLVGITVRSYLSWLKDTERINAEFENNVLIWKKI